MSRHTRWLRKQARAKAAEQQQNQQFTGGTALLDQPAAARVSLLDDLDPGELDPSDLDPGDLDSGELDPAEAWTAADLEATAVAGDVQVRHARPHQAPPAETEPRDIEPRDVPPVRPEAKAGRHGSRPGSRPDTPASARQVIPGREPVGEPAPGQPRLRPNEGWLWRDKIRMGDLVVIVGDEGSGKTRVLTDWIARVTTGRAFPGTPDPTHALPPSDVLVFNCVDDFEHCVLDQVALNEGDPDRVLHASTQLLDWGHSHSEFPPTGGRQLGLPVGELAAGELAEPRVRLHTQEILRKLEQFLIRRPSIRMVVIDQLKQHLKIDSERVFEDLIYELQVLGRQTQATFVLTQRPDAFRNATGLKRYFKSDSLISVARAIWRVAEPEDPANGDRVLECLKLNHGFGDSGREPWRLWQDPGQPLRWELGTGQEFPLSKLDAKQRLLFHAKTFISLYLRMFGGLADFETLRICARREGITGSKLMEASIVYDFGYEFETCPESEIGIRKIIGAWSEILKRREIPEPDRPPVVGPPLPKRRRKPGPLAPAPLAIAPLSRVPVAPSPTPEAHPAAVPAVAESAAESVVAIPIGAAVGSGWSAPAVAPRPAPTPEQRLESLRARVARGEARLREFDLEGLRFIKPNLATCHLLLNLEADLGSEEAVIDFLREGLVESGKYSAEDLATYVEEYRRLIGIAKQLAAHTDGQEGQRE